MNTKRIAAQLIGVFMVVSALSLIYVVRHASMTLDFSWAQLALNFILWFAGMTALVSGALLFYAWTFKPGREEEVCRAFWDAM
jgi:hypothetical protein